MRIIDEDKLLLDIINRGVDHIQTDDYAEICQIIAEQPTIPAVPIEVLQEIRQEINQKGRDKFSLKDEYEHYLKGLTDCLDIIDSHISAISRKSISDRDCEHCKHRHPIGCDVWECTFEPRDEDKDEEDNE